MPDDDRLPPGLVEYLRRRQKQNAPLCPRCGRRKIQVAETGWCHACTDEHREAELARKRKWWGRHRGSNRDRT